MPADTTFLLSLLGSPAAAASFPEYKIRLLLLLNAFSTRFLYWSPCNLEKISCALLPVLTDNQEPL